MQPEFQKRKEYAKIETPTDTKNEAYDGLAIEICKGGSGVLQSNSRAGGLPPTKKNKRFALFITANKAKKARSYQVPGHVCFSSKQMRQQHPCLQANHHRVFD